MEIKPLSVTIRIPGTYLIICNGEETIARLEVDEYLPYVLQKPGDQVVMVDF